MTDKYFKPCECGCGEMIPIINKLGKSARFKTHHNIKSGKNAIHWKGGRRINTQGYILIYNPTHPFCDSQKSVREHRLVMEQYLTKLNGITTYIHPSVEIDHIDGNKQNNDIKNLRIFVKRQHMSMHKLSGKIIPIHDRICFICNNNKTGLRNNKNERWYYYKDNVICQKCYCKVKYMNRKK